MLRRLWGIYGALVFGVLLLLYFPFFLLLISLFPKWATPRLIWFNHHVFGPTFFALTLIRIQVEGRSYLKEDEAYIIVSNHQSSVDFMANSLAFPGIYRYLAKKELARIPFLGFIVKRLCVLVDRSSLRSKIRSINYLKEVLKQGTSVFIYPEGTRKKDACLGTFHQGAFHLAITTGAPVAIQVLTNIDHISGGGLHPGTLKIVWLPPIETKGMTAADVPLLKKRVHQLMLEQLSPAGVFELQ